MVFSLRTGSADSRASELKDRAQSTELVGIVDVERCLSPISESAPCGENLEYDPAYAEMERAAQSKPEQQFGDTVIPSEEPDWPSVRRLALDLLDRSRDLRVAVQHARAALATDGFRGFSVGLAVVRGLLERCWEQVHPQLDPDDGLDPTLRVNTIASLCDGDTTLRYVRQAPLVVSRAVGRFSLRDLAVASGELPPKPDETPPDRALIEAAFADADVDDLQADAASVRAAIEHVGTIETVLSDRVGAGNAVDLNPLVRILSDAEKILAEQLKRRGVGVEPEASAAVAGGNGAPGNGDAAAPDRIAGTVQSREDVVRALDLICDYYDRYEPSSPLPLLLKRARRLTSKTFVEILRDLVPDGLPQALTIGGIQNGESETE